MKSLFSRFILTFLCAFSTLFVFAEDKDYSPIFSLDVNGGCAFYHSLQPNGGIKPYSLSNRNAPYVEGQGFYLRGEYYLPFTKWSLKGGYEIETIQVGAISSSSNIHQLMLGTRYYPLQGKLFVEPFVGVDGLINIGTRTLKDVRETYDDAFSPVRRESTHIRTPLFSVAPVGGLSFKLFSTLSFMIEYSYRIGIDSHIRFKDIDKNNQTAVAFKAPFNRHQVLLGLKITFPLKGKSIDSGDVITNLFNILYNIKR